MFDYSGHELPASLCRWDGFDGKECPVPRRASPVQVLLLFKCVFTFCNPLEVLFL